MTSASVSVPSTVPAKILCDPLARRRMNVSAPAPRMAVTKVEVPVTES